MALPPMASLERLGELRPRLRQRLAVPAPRGVCGAARGQQNACIVYLAQATYWEADRFTRPIDSAGRGGGEGGKGEGITHTS
jgi:hypothetical protein